MKRKTKLGEDMMLFTTDPHGAQQIIRVEKQSFSKADDREDHGNSLYAIKDDSKRPNGIVMTGEELTSLTRQWLSYCGVDAYLVALLASSADITTIKGLRQLAKKAMKLQNFLKVKKGGS